MNEITESTDPDEQFELEKQKSYPFETTRVGNVVYNVELLRKTADALPTQTIPISELSAAVSEGNYYWIDKNGQKLGPHQLLRDWEAAKQNPAWRDHIETIEQTDLSRPLWLDSKGEVINGMHRLVRASLEGRTEVGVKVFKDFPPEAVVNE